MYDPYQTIFESCQPVGAPRYLSDLVAPPSGTFASRVVMKDIITVRACYLGDRCTGMAFTFAMDRVEILGQWFECTGHHELIFDTVSDKYLTGLQFELHGPYHEPVVRKVTLLTMETSGTSSGDIIRVAKCSDTIVWIYSELCDEIIVSQQVNEPED
ncbi:hypothetical protein IQ07DRAFT_340507 [Pyrenochaeta sp. DS3sAY3a]|nr:hypothetical protein IQ07DRAFT_340507 [Pyrenochaeta sp. DS3sAY3a]